MSTIFLDGASIRPQQAGVRVYYKALLGALCDSCTGKFHWVCSINKDLWESFPIELQRRLEAAPHLSLRIDPVRGTLSKFLFSRPPHADLTVFPDYYPTSWRLGKFAVVVHDLHFRAHPKSFSFLKRLFRSCVFKALPVLKPQIFTISKETANEVTRYYPGLSSRVSIIGSGTEIECLSPAPIEEISGDQYLLTIGTLNEHKNYDRLIEAYCDLCERLKLRSQTQKAVPPLIIIGKPGNDTDRICTAIEGALKRGFDVRWISGLSDAQIAWAYRNATGVVLPSTYEGYGLPLAEALVLEQCVVCSDISVFREIGGETPTYFDPNDPSAISKALEALLNGDIKKPSPNEFDALRFAHVPLRIEAIAKNLKNADH